MQFIGHRFAKVNNVDGKFVTGATTLIKVEVVEEFTRIFSPASFLINVVTEGLLSFTEANSQGFVNIFDYDENMRIDEEKMQADIEKYGLYTYEDFKDLLTYEVFITGQWKYFKVAVGKGQLTWEDIVWLIEYVYEQMALQGAM